MNNSKIQTNVMRRVRTIHILRPMVGTHALAFVFSVLAIAGIGHEVFVAQVIANMPSITNVSALVRFFTFAFLNTTFVVQALIGICVIASAWFVADGIRTLKGKGQFA